MFCSHFQITTRKYPLGNVYVQFHLLVTVVTLYGVWNRVKKTPQLVLKKYSFFLGKNTN